MVLTGVGCKYIQAGRCNAEVSTSTHKVRAKQGMRLKREFAPPAALPGVQLPLEAQVPILEILKITRDY